MKHALVSPVGLSAINRNEKTDNLNSSGKQGRCSMRGARLIASGRLLHKAKINLARGHLCFYVFKKSNKINVLAIGF